jgi:uncharacterized protein (DUF2147 family)
VKKFVLLASFCLFFTLGEGQSIVGVWESVDEANQTPVHYIEIFKQSNYLYAGRVVKSLKYGPTTTCSMCPGDLRGQPLISMRVLEEMRLEDGYFKGGKLLDPIKGRWYGCEMWLKEGDPNTLVVRQFVGPLFRTLHWRKVSEVTMR